MVSIRRLSDIDFKDYARISLEAFPAMYPKMSEEQIQGWIQRMQEQQAKEEDVEYYGYFIENNLLGVMRLHTFKMNVYGIEMLAGGVGNICVDLTHKKERIAKELMEYFHNLYWDMDAPIVLLWPFRHEFYQSMGYGYARKYNKYMYRPEDLPIGSKEGVTFMTEDDIDALKSCYNRYASKTHGMIYKKRVFFERFIQRYKVVGFRNHDKVEGFIGFNFKKLDPDNLLRQNLEIDYMITENPAAFSKIMTFLHTQLDQVERVIFQTYDDDLHYASKDPRNGVPHIFYINQETNVQGLGVMYRILNTELFFKNLKDHTFNDENLRIRFDVRDSFMSKNNRALTIHFRDGKPVIADGHDVQVTINIEYLSSLLMGVVDFRKLWKYGLVALSDEHYISQVDELFHVRNKPETIEEF